MAGYIEDRWLKKRPNKQTGQRERTALWGKGQRYRVKGIPGVQDRSFETSAEAKQWLATTQTDSKRGQFIDPRDGEILLAEYIEEHWWPGRSDEPSTAAPMRSRIWNHIIPLLGTTMLRDIDASALRTFKADLLERVDESTAEVIWIHLTTILNAAVDDKRLLKNPVKMHRMVKAPKGTRKKAKAWRRSTVGAVRAELQERYRFAVDIGLVLGLRQGEAFGLGEENFDFDAGVVHVRRQLRWDSKRRPYLCLPKGGKTRLVQLSPRPGPPLRAKAHMQSFPLSSAPCHGAIPSPQPLRCKSGSGSPSRFNSSSALLRATASTTAPGTNEAGSPRSCQRESFGSWKRSSRLMASGSASDRSSSCPARTCSTHCATPTPACNSKPASRSSACPSGSATPLRRSRSTTTLTSCPGPASAAS